MFKIYPQIEFAAQCPRDSTELNIKNIAIPGMRCLAEGYCPECDRNYYVDLPVSHGINYQTFLDRVTGKSYDRFNITWFGELLEKTYAQPIAAEVFPIVHKFFTAKNIVILNCLDYLYGHCLLKLLNIQRYLDNYPELGCCVLVPSQLIHLVPEGVAEIWEFPAPIKEGGNWYYSLQKWFEDQLTNYQECFLSPVYSHPSDRVYDLDKFVRNLPDISTKIPQNGTTILFSYREDRLWGNSLKHQQNNLQNLYDKLHLILEDFIFVLVGFGEKNQIQHKRAQIIDLRVNQFDRQTDLFWLAYMKAADCVVGVHGSNMLLPSGLAKSTVELVPRSRLGNTVQDFLFSRRDRDPRDALLFYRMLYGNENLSDISARDVLDLIITNLTHAIINSNSFKLGEELNNSTAIHSMMTSKIFQNTNEYFQESEKNSSLKKIVKNKLDFAKRPL